MVAEPGNEELISVPKMGWKRDGEWREGGALDRELWGGDTEGKAL